MLTFWFSWHHLSRITKRRTEIQRDLLELRRQILERSERSQRKSCQGLEMATMHRAGVVQDRQSVLSLNIWHNQRGMVVRLLQKNLRWSNQTPGHQHRRFQIRSTWPRGQKRNLRLWNTRPFPILGPSCSAKTAWHDERVFRLCPRLQVWNRRGCGL